MDLVNNYRDTDDVLFCLWYIVFWGFFCYQSDSHVLLLDWRFFCFIKYSADSWFDWSLSLTPSPHQQRGMIPPQYLRHSYTPVTQYRDFILMVLDAVVEHLGRSNPSKSFLLVGMEGKEWDGGMCLIFRRMCMYVLHPLCPRRGQSTLI